MERIVETARGSIRILGLNKAPMNDEEMEVEQSPAPEKDDTERGTRDL